MKFDQTYIAIRKRNLLEIVDLSFHVIRDYLLPLTILWLLGTVPFMLLNWWLIGWMAEDYYDYPMLWSYLYVAALLVCVEAQMATTFITNYLGQAIFAQRPTVGSAIKATLKTNPYYWFVHGAYRMVLPVLLLVAAIDPDVDRESFVGSCVLISLLVGLGLIVRAVRPFASEILSLEKTPIFKTDGQINYGLRSSSLHRAANSELLGRFVLVCLISVPLAATVTGTLLILDYVLNLHATSEYLPIVLYGPIAMWIVAGFVAVARFLSYIDIRIRQEGWEVELRLRAESMRLEKGLT